MIWSLNKELFPCESKAKEILTINDNNEENWVVAIVTNGMLLAYNGHDCFSQELFYLGRIEATIKNTNCWFIETKDMDFFFELRDEIKGNNTGDVFDFIANFIEERIMHTKSYTKEELVNK